MTQNAHYRTSDTALASYLVTENFPLLSIDYSQPRFEFVFPMSAEIQELASKYLIGKARTDPVVFNKVNKKFLRVIRRQIQWEED